VQTSRFLTIDRLDVVPEKTPERPQEKDANPAQMPENSETAIPAEVVDVRSET